MPNIIGFSFLLAHWVPPFKLAKDEMSHQSAIFEKSWLPFCQIWIIFTQVGENLDWINWRLKGKCPLEKWNESGFRPLLCTYRLNWARRTSWGWCNEWDDTALQTQDSKLEPWRSEAEHATSRSRRLPTILSFTSGWGRNILVSFKPPRPGNEPRTLGWKAAVLTTTPGPRPPLENIHNYLNERCILV